jgi:parallel beta-helix repeat protein
MKRRTFLVSSLAGLTSTRLLNPSTSLSQGSEPAKYAPIHRFLHPGILQNISDLNFIKAKIDAGEDPWKTAWDNLLTQPSSSLDFAPQPRAHIYRGSYGAGQTGVDELNAAVAAAESHVLQWWVGKNEDHAHKCIEILDAWSGALCDFAGNDAMLLAGWTGGTWANAAEILRFSYPAWTSGSITRFKRMLETVYLPLLRGYFPEANGNWDGAIMHSLLALAVFCEDQPLLESVVRHFRFGNGNAGITRYIYPNGQCEESTRDQGHTQLGLGYFALTARIAWKQGIDLFAEADDRLALGFEYTSRYMRGEQVQSFGTVSETLRGRFDDFYEAAFQHYRFEKGLAMPNTEQAVMRARERSWHGVLTLFRGDTNRSQPAKAAPAASSIAMHAGAQPTETKASSAYLNVKPGESIQGALDSVAGKVDAVIQLAAGLHTLEKPLNLPSGVTLAGAGRTTVLFLDPKQQGPAIIGAARDLHDVILRDFVIEGGAQAQLSRDPNQDSRPRRSQMAPLRGGVTLRSDGTARQRNMRIERLTVLHCTLSAVDIFGADQVQIIDCDLAGSGGAVSPGAGQHHNLKLSSVSHVEISGSRLADSLCGGGSQILLSSDVTISNCELTRNASDGIHLLASRGVTIKGCLLEGNEGFPASIETAGMLRPLASIAHGNIIRNNAEYVNPILRA